MLDARLLAAASLLLGCAAPLQPPVDQAGAAPTSSAGAAPAPLIDVERAEAVELTHAFDERTLYWPGAPSGFKLEQLAHGPTPGGYFYAANAFCAPEQSRDFMVHRIAAGAEVLGFENLANLERLPARGAWVIALPMKIARASGGPLRIVALVPR